MRFNLLGIDYDTATMTAFETGQACLPMVYVNANGQIFLETRRDRWQEPRMRRIPRFEALRIAALYELDTFKQFLMAEKPTEEKQTSTRSSRTTESDRELIAQLHDFTPDQLDRLAKSLQLSQN